MDHCATHASLPASWTCAGCHKNLCDACTKGALGSGAGALRCAHCGAGVAPIPGIAAAVNGSTNAGSGWAARARSPTGEVGIAWPDLDLGSDAVDPSQALREALLARDPTSALREFDALLSLGIEPSMEPILELCLAHALDDADRSAEAAQACQRAALYDISGPLAGRAIYLAGRLFVERLGRRHDGQTLLEQVARDYPDDEFADRARDMLRRYA